LEDEIKKKEFAKGIWRGFLQRKFWKGELRNDALSVMEGNAENRVIGSDCDWGEVFFDL
jgi:hypothetical protein